MTKTSYPEDISCIINGGINKRGAIYISNLEAAQNIETLKKYSIGAILTAAEGVVVSHPRQVVRFYKQIPALDHHSFDISVYFDEAIKFIEEARRVTNVLVHCVAGVSRSVSLVLAYFIKNYRLNLSEALTLVRSHRNIISPNQGFLKQLAAFQQTVQGVQTERCHSESQPRKSHLQKSIEIQPNTKRPLSMMKNTRLLFDFKMIDRKISDIKNKNWVAKCQDALTFPLKSYNMISSRRNPQIVQHPEKECASEVS